MENCEMNLCKLGYQADINSRGNMSAVVLRLPRYLRSEWAKEAQNSRDQGKEPDFSQLTKFVLKRAKLANTEYGRFINTNPKSNGKETRTLGLVDSLAEFHRLHRLDPLKNKVLRIPVIHPEGDRLQNRNATFVIRKATLSKYVSSSKGNHMMNGKPLFPSKDCVIFAFLKGISPRDVRNYTMDALFLDVENNTIPCFIPLILIETTKSKLRARQITRKSKDRQPVLRPSNSRMLRQDTVEQSEL
jgi:hypothetical protein